MQKEVQVTVVGRVFKPNTRKVRALNRCFEQYLGLVKWYLQFQSTSKKFLHKNGYDEAKQRFYLNTALIQTARDKAVEILKSFRKTKRKSSILTVKRISIRFDSRCYTFSKTTNVLTPYWLTLSLDGRQRISLPIIFGEYQKERIEKAFSQEWQFKTVDMIKKNGIWYAHFVLSKTICFSEPETVIGIDRGEVNFAVAVAISKSNPEKPLKGQFWRGSKVKQIRGLYSHIRRKLQEKKLLKKVKEIGAKERRKVNQQLHIIANQIIEYAKQFPKPVIVMENLNGIRRNFKKSKKLNRRFHSLPFRKLQTIVEYKANLEGIEVKYLTKKQTRHTTKQCHRCGYVAPKVNGRIYKCPECGMEYDRDLNACINIAHRVMSSMGWGSCDTPKLSGDVKCGKL